MELDTGLRVTRMTKSSLSKTLYRKVLGCLLCLSCIAPACAWAQTSSPAVQAQNQPTETSQAPKISIGPGDLLDIEVFDTPELSGTARVNQTGEVNLSVVGTIHLAGLTAGQASRQVEEQLHARGLMIDPHVTVSISEYASQGATLMGEVRTPGIYPTLGRRKLLDMIALAGGPTPLAGKTATVIHREDPTHPIDVALAPNAGSLAAQQNPIIGPGDTVVIAKAGIVYIIGDVLKPGGFLVDNNEHISLMQALTLAGGWTKTSATNQTRLIRKVPEGREEIRLDLKKVAYGTQADLKVMDGDIVFVPSSLIKTLSYRGLEAAITAAQQVAVFSVYQ
jgi:polysaccharide export outer membrane protein